MSLEFHDNLPAMTADLQTPTFAAAVYHPDTGDRMALLKFVEMLKQSNTVVGGVLQEAVFGKEGEIIGINAIDVSNNHRIPISRPVKNDDECGLDVSALVETTGIIRRAVSEQVELVVIEKFGEQEQNGKGMFDEIFQTIAEGIPLLIAVPATALPIWQERSGELGAVLPFDQSVFEGWWQSVK